MSEPVPAPEHAPPQDVMRLAMSEFMKARFAQLRRDGVDPSLTAVNVSLFGVQFEALASLLIDAGVFTRDQFQSALANSAGRLATAMNEQLKLIVTPDKMN